MSVLVAKGYLLKVQISQKEYWIPFCFSYEARPNFMLTVLLFFSLVDCYASSKDSQVGVY